MFEDCIRDRLMGSVRFRYRSINLLWSLLSAVRKFFTNQRWLLRNHPHAHVYVRACDAFDLPLDSASVKSARQLQDNPRDGNWDTCHLHYNYISLFLTPIYYVLLHQLYVVGNSYNLQIVQKDDGIGSLTASTP